MSEVKHTPLPCPFCGAEGEIQYRSNPMSKWKWSVECGGTTCGASGPVEASQADAIAAWNRRVPVNSHGDLVEALRDFRLSVECAAGCDEDAGAAEKYGEILKAFGTAVAASYLRADTALSKVLELGEGL